MENPRIYPFQGVPSDIIVSVTGGRGKMPVTDPFLPEQVEHLFRTLHFIFIDPGKGFLQLFLRSQDHFLNTIHAYNLTANIFSFRRTHLLCRF